MVDRRANCGHGRTHPALHRTRCAHGPQSRCGARQESLSTSTATLIALARRGSSRRHAYRRECLGTAVATCRHTHVEAELRLAAARHSVIRDAGANGPLLVITEGLRVYLAPGQVNELATQLRGEADTRWWSADLITPLLQRTMGMVWGSQLNDADAAFRFAPDHPKSHFRELYWLEVEFHSTWTDSIRLGRIAPNALMWDTPVKWSGPAGGSRPSAVPYPGRSSLRLLSVVEPNKPRDDTGPGVPVGGRGQRAFGRAQPPRL